MSPRPHGSDMVCQVLRQAVNLAEAIEAAQKRRRDPGMLAPLARIPNGPWSAQWIKITPDRIGLLALEGLRIRGVGVGSAPVRAGSSPCADSRRSSADGWRRHSGAAI